ncbi:uncharacterized protein BDR25DRAFT_357373 [Lindgomyces ingoldianus]|uniref:Uncharacterized protein n=1 Tax=Lindgomyces ingoldianus TaxID=673940 RepID=A0ACB6QPE7_9PLEO|nr:uncharacterized protein BDR25DRAFT_357373 [Lindgomyces ingoldianus]KAF2468443.1 hypothetical protein BDR25DRAFT_357373 [Lindgomyces ingoldianus]
MRLTLTTALNDQSPASLSKNNYRLHLVSSSPQESFLVLQFPFKTLRYLDIYPILDLLELVASPNYHRKKSFTYFLPCTVFLHEASFSLVLTRRHSPILTERIIASFEDTTPLQSYGDDRHLLQYPSHLYLSIFIINMKMLLGKILIAITYHLERLKICPALLSVGESSPPSLCLTVLTVETILIAVHRTEGVNIATTSMAPVHYPGSYTRLPYESLSTPMPARMMVDVLREAHPAYDNSPESTAIIVEAQLLQKIDYESKKLVRIVDRKHFGPTLPVHDYFSFLDPTLELQISRLLIPWCICCPPRRLAWRETELIDIPNAPEPWHCVLSAFRDLFTTIQVVQSIPTEQMSVTHFRNSSNTKKDKQTLFRIVGNYVE